MTHSIVYLCSFYQWKSISFFQWPSKSHYSASLHTFFLLSSLLTYHYIDLCRNPPPTLQQPELWSPEFNDFINKWVKTSVAEHGIRVHVMCNVMFWGHLLLLILFLKNLVCKSSLTSKWGSGFKTWINNILRRFTFLFFLPWRILSFKM